MPFSSRIRSLLESMTLAEKIGQLNQYTDFGDLTGPEADNMNLDERREDIRQGRVGSMLNVLGADATREMQDLALQSRLKIPLVFGYDVIHGLRTVFPIPLGEAASWNLDGARIAARFAAEEASAAGIGWTFSPNVDVAPDQRWGRVMEGAGECPYLGEVFAKARIEGFQGTDLSLPNTIAACAKHLAGYGYAEAGREYNTVQIGDYTLHNEVLPPFRAAVKSGVASVMNGFHLLNGLPVTASKFLQREWLKEGQQWPGVVVSDWNSIGEMEAHGITADRAEASRIALEAGCDVDMEASGYLRYLKGAVEEGLLNVSLIDEACLRVLHLKELLGLFDDPYRYSDSEREARVTGNAAIKQAAREAAAASCVLLKNEVPAGSKAPLLPLDTSKIKRIAVIGELAAETDSTLGSWRIAAQPASAISLLQGVAEALGYGVKANTKAPVASIDARSIAPSNPCFEVADLLDPQSDTPIEIRYARGPALLHPASDRVFVKRLTLNDTDTAGLEEAEALARWADVVILGVGEHGFMSGEARSRTDIGLPKLQQVLAKAVVNQNPNTVVVLYHGRALAIPELAEKASAIVCAWQPGSEGGRGIADVLFGKTEPTGRLPVSFPYTTGQCPLTYRRFATGRPNELPDNSVWWSHYEDAPNGPLFPFGYGLGYSTFSIKNIRLSAKQLTARQSVTLSCEVTNTSETNGSTVVQLYIRDLAAKRARPMRELKGFERVSAPAGETTSVSFHISVETLAYWTPEEDWHTEPGKFEIFLGFNSRDLSEAVLLELV